MNRSDPINLNDLDEKLKRIIPRPSRETSPRHISDLDHSEHVRTSRAYAEEHYDALIQLGGRPTRSIQYEPVLPIQQESGDWFWADGSPAYDSGEEQNDEETWEKIWIQHHWDMEGVYFGGELDEWKGFRAFQQRIRRTPEAFLKKQLYIDDYCLRKGIKEELKPQLRIEPQMQTKAEEWKEFYYYQHARLAGYEKRIEKAQEELQIWLDQFDAAERGAGQQRSADAPSSEKRWLRGELVDRGEIQFSGQCSVESRKREMKKWEARLQEIEQQLPTVAAECATSTQASPNALKPSQTKGKTRRTCKNTKTTPARSALKVKCPSRVSKTPKDNPSACNRQQLLSRGAPSMSENLVPAQNLGLVMDSQASSPSVAPRRSQRISNYQNKIPIPGPPSTALSSVRLSKVSKAPGKISSQVRWSSGKCLPCKSSGRTAKANVSRSNLSAGSGTVKRSLSANDFLRRSERLARNSS
ncbi:MAG: hypothetical protein Q9180_001303 [Flavoplaca navasiana]